MSSDRGSRHSSCAALLMGALSLAAFIALNYPLLLGKLYVHTDFAAFHLPMRVFYQRCLERGDSFAWMPDILCGFYAAGEGQAGMFHPLHWMLYRFLPLSWAFNIEFLYSYPLMFAGLFMLLRRWRLPVSAGLFGAFTFTFSAFCLLRAPHMNVIQIAAHTPWLLLAIDHILDPEACPGVRRRWWVAATLLTASQLLLGFPQGVYLSSVAECLYVLLVLRWHQPAWSIPWLFALLGAKMLALALAAIQILPSYEMLLESQRHAASYEFRMQFSLNPVNIVQFLGPYFFANRTGVTGNPAECVHGQELGLYCGAAATVLMLWVTLRLILGSNIPARRLAVGALILVLFGFVLSLGRFGYLYRALATLPFLSAFRCPCRHIVLIDMAMAVLSAIGFADLLQMGRSGERFPWKWSWIMFLPAFAAWTLAFYLLGVIDQRFPFPELYRFWLPQPTALWIAPALLTLAALLLLALARGRFLVLGGLLVFAVADQSYYGMRNLADVPKPRTLDEFQRAIPLPPVQDGCRVDAKGNNLLSIRGVENFSGYIGPFLNRTFAHDTDNPQALRLANVRWTLNMVPGVYGKTEWKEDPNPLPYVRMLSRTKQSSEPVKDADTVDLAVTAITGDLISLPEGPPGQARLVEKRPGVITVRTESSTRQLLAVAESWHPGWRVSVDGEAATVLRINGDFQGCVIEPGTHEVRFSFAPMGLAVGKGITVTALVFLLVVCALLFKPQTKNGKKDGDIRSQQPARSV